MQRRLSLAFFGEAESVLTAEGAASDCRPALFQMRFVFEACHSPMTESLRLTGQCRVLSSEKGSNMTNTEKADFKNCPETSRPNRAEQREAQLQKGLSRPGIADAIRVFESWKEKDQVQTPYRDVLSGSPAFIATDHANFDQPIR